MKGILFKILIGVIALAILGIGIALVVGYVSASSDGEEDLSSLPPEVFMEAIEPPERDAEIEYRIDVINAKTLFVSVRAHPGAGWPDITGGYVETRVTCLIRIRGISVPTACQTLESRYRPFEEIRLERERCEASINYTWSLLNMNKKLKLSNPELMADGVVECDVKYSQGGAWHDLAKALIADEHARVELVESNWNWGSRHVKPY